MKHALLLDPPSRGGFARDYGLGWEREEGLELPPLELALLSGALAPARVTVLDARSERLGPEAALKRAAAAAPDAVFFLSSGATYMEDTPFLAQLRQKLPYARFVGMGDLYRELRELSFSLHPFLDAVLLDASTADAAALAWGEPAARAGALVRGPAGVIAPPAGRAPRAPWRPSLPDWKLFPLKAYGVPFGSGPAAGLLTDYGCPFLCSYCPMSRAGFRLRELSGVLDEARLLASLGVRHLFLRDQTFGAARGRTLELLAGLRPLKLTWVASTRVDLVSPELLAAMRDSGCAAVHLGLDSLDDEVLRSTKKNTSRRQASEAVRLVREAGLKAWGSVVVGLALDTRESLEATLAAVDALKLDRLSVRLEQSRYASDYRRDLLVRGLVPPESLPPDTPTTTSVWQGRLALSNQDALSYFRRARGGDLSTGRRPDRLFAPS